MNISNLCIMYIGEFIGSRNFLTSITRFLGTASYRTYTAADPEKKFFGVGVTEWSKL